MDSLVNLSGLRRSVITRKIQRTWKISRNQVNDISRISLRDCSFKGGPHKACVLSGPEQLIASFIGLSFFS